MLFTTFVLMVVSLGYVGWDNEQIGTVCAFGAAFIIVAFQFGSALVTETYVTPLVDPKDEDGSPLTRVDNEPSLAYQRKVMSDS